MNGTGRISMNDWKLALEEAKEAQRAGQVWMRICGPGADGRWVRSAPVKGVIPEEGGWNVYTENPKELYFLRMNPGQRAGWERLWGRNREQWQILIGRLPGELQAFARLWEHPSWDPEALMEKITLLGAREKKMLGRKGIFLYLDASRPCYGGNYYIGKGTDIRYIWGRVFQEIRPNGSSLICARSKWGREGSPWLLYLDVFYRIVKEDEVEMARAVCRHKLLEKISHEDWTAELVKTPDALLENKLYLCNTGEKDLYIRVSRQGEWEVICLHPYNKVKIIADEREGRNG